MIVSHVDKIEGVKVELEDARGVTMKVLVSPSEGWEGWIMREFIVDEGGNTPRHKHPWPHINYVLEGEGIVHVNGVDNAITTGSFAYVPSDTEHQFRNAGSGALRFICIIPEHS